MFSSSQSRGGHHADGPASPNTLEYDYLESGQRLQTHHHHQQHLQSEPVTPAPLLPLASRRKKAEQPHQPYSHSRNAGLPSRPYDDDEDDSRGLRPRTIPIAQRIRVALRWPRWIAVPPIGLFLLLAISYLRASDAGAESRAALRQPAAVEPMTPGEVELDPTLIHTIDPTHAITQRAMSSASSASSAFNATNFDPASYRHGAANPHFQPPRILPLPPYLVPSESSSSSFSSTSPSSGGRTPLTIFTTMRDLTPIMQRTNPSEYLRMWNALRSWRRLGLASPSATPVINVLLFVDHPEETCQHLREAKQLDMTGLTCHPIPCFSEVFKKPLMNCLWEKAVELATTKYVAFVNGDVVVLDDFDTVFQTTVAACPRQVLVAQRRDVPQMDWPREKLTYFVNVINSDEDGESEGEGSEDKDEKLSASTSSRGRRDPGGTTLIYEYPFHQPEFLSAFRQHIRQHGRLHPDTGLDLFVFHKSLFTSMLPRFPEFLVGVYRWDNWLASEWLVRSGGVSGWRGGEWERKFGLEPRGSWQSDAASSNISSLSRHPFLVVDCTHAVTLIHDSLRSDHLHDLGAVHNDELVKSRVGLRYKVGRVGNADMQVRWATEEEKAAAPTPDSAPSSSTSSGLVLSHNVSPDRLDLLLTRVASPSGTVGVLSVSSAFLPLATNFLCWSQQRSEWPHILVLAEDLAVYREMWAWQLDFLTILLYPNATASAPASSAAADDDADPHRYWSGPLLWRHQILARSLDLGFTLLTVDPDTIWFSNPVPVFERALLRVEQQREWKANRPIYLSSASIQTGGDGFPVIPKCTILAITRGVKKKKNKLASEPIDSEAAEEGDAPPSQILSTATFMLRANKFSRFYLKKLGDCLRGLLSSPSSGSLLSAHARQLPSRYLEDRCSHDVLRSMHTELSRETAQDFHVCRVPKEMWMDWPRFVRLASTSDGSDERAPKHTPMTRTRDQQRLARQQSAWTFQNDPSASQPELAAPPMVDSEGALLLPPSMMALGFSADSKKPYVWPSILHDSTTDAEAHGEDTQSAYTLASVTSPFSRAAAAAAEVARKVTRWQQAGLWCSFRPELLAQGRTQSSPPAAIAAAAATIPSAAASTPSASVLPPPPPPPPPSSSFFLRLHLRLSPSPNLTARSLRAFFRHIQTQCRYAPMDVIDLDLELAAFWTEKEKERDRVRKRVREKRGMDAGSSTGPTDKTAPTVVDSPPPASAAAAGVPLDDPLESAVGASLLHLPADPLLWPLTSSEVLSEFGALKWSLGMKQILTATIRMVDPTYADSTSPTAGSAQAATAAASQRLADEQLADQAYRWPHGDDDGGEWLVPYLPKDGTGGADVPIALMTPFMRLHPNWHGWVKRQCQQWSSGSSSSSPPTSTSSSTPPTPTPMAEAVNPTVDRRWLGLTLVPLVTTVGDLHGTSTLNRSPYPSAYHLLSASERPRPALPPVPRTNQLHVVADEFLLRERAREVEELRPGGGNATLSGRRESIAYRTQIFHPAEGLVIFASTIQQMNAWKKAQVAVAAAANGQANGHGTSTQSSPPVATSAAGAPSVSPSSSTSFPPCFSRPSFSSSSFLLRYLFSTGSFVTAPAFPDGTRSLGKDLLRGLSERDWPRVDWEANPFARERPVDLTDAFLPTALGASPLFDLTGASVPLPDALAYRHLILKAAHGHGAATAGRTTEQTNQEGSRREEPTPMVDQEAGCPRPPMHTRMAEVFSRKS